MTHTQNRFRLLSAVELQLSNFLQNSYAFSKQQFSILLEFNILFTKVFLFTCQILVVIVASQQTPSHPPYNVKPDKCFSCQWQFQRCRFSPFQRFIYCYIVYNFVALFPVTAQHTRTLLLKCQPQNIETLLSTALGFPIGKRVTDHCSNSAPEFIGFSQELLSP